MAGNLTKRIFERFIKVNTEDLPLEEQEKKLYQIRNWIDEIIEKFHTRTNKKYQKCSKCNKYSLKTKYTRTTEKEERKGECVLHDCGYGDDDLFADVTYLVTYETCPICGNKREVDKWYLSETNQKYRWEYKQ